MSGRSVVVDTNVFLSARNRLEPGYEACRELLDRIDRGEVHAIVSTVTIAEIRAGFSAHEVRTVWKALLSHLLTSPSFQVEPVDAEIGERAGEIRSSSRLTLPDAIIVATGHLRGASLLVTQDTEIARKQTVIPVGRPHQVA